MKKMIMILAVISTALLSQTNPVVSNVSMSITGTTVTVTYDVSDVQQGTVNIGMKVSNNDGATWDFNYGTASGAIGNGVATGTGKAITWTYSGGQQNFLVMITANDIQVGGDNCGKVYYEGGPNIDGEGAYYNTIMIGNKCWLKENLDIGEMIHGGTDQTNCSVIERYCYDNNPQNCYENNYGGLYQWAEAVQYLNGASNTTSPSPAFSGNVRGICPPGWHIPTYAELLTLKAMVNDNSNILKNTSVGTGGGVGTNTSGFSALLAGRRRNYGTFTTLGSNAFFWSSTELSSSKAYVMDLIGSSSSVTLIDDNKGYGFSVRCVQD